MNVQPAIVVLRALGLGDFLTAVPAYRAIARAFPAHRRTLAAPRAVHALVPLLGDVFAAVYDVAALGELPPAADGVELAINLHGRGPQSHRRLLERHPQRLVAFANEAADIPLGGAPWVEDAHEIERWCTMLAYHDIPADPHDLGIGVPGVALPAGLHRATVLHPGAATRARRWPVERWVTVARACAAQGDRVVVTGAGDESALTAEIVRRAGLPSLSDLGGRTSLRDLAALVAHAERVLCGDTGIAHLASAYATPSVVLFGPVSPAQWGPPRRARHRVLWAGATGDPQATTIDRGLLHIEPSHVLEQIERLRSLARPHLREGGEGRAKRVAATSSSAPR